MATYDSLPVFKASYDLLLKIFNLGQHWQRDIKYTLGEELKKDMFGILTLIYQANATRDKDAYIEQARVGLVKVKLQLRLLHDLKQMSLKQYALSAEMSESISKQLAAWAKSQRAADLRN